MNTSKTKIHQINLYDIPMNKGGLRKFMSRVFQLVEQNTGAFRGVPAPLDLFHDKSHHYSGIQFGIVDGAVSIRAYGKTEIKALKIWWQLYRKQYAFKPENVQVIQEKYRLGFLPQPQTYRLNDFLVNKNKQKELNEIEDDETKKNILSEYIVANFFPFFNHLNYRHNRKEQEIVARVLRYKRQNKPQGTFRDYKRQAYDIVFETNLRLPHLFRMGEATALGYGNVNYQ